ncbi:MAG: iron-containing redox enzyme family protein [Deltaproteobacteria bacterium]|nr:iron-containing redox enzyme family protein [Deltaproteobacteria bacterium]
MEHLLEVRKRVFDELRDTQVVKTLFHGTLDRAAYVRYLLNAYNYAQHSPKVMAVAAARCTDTHPELATYLLHHAIEEQGHYLWALEDLRDLNVGDVEAQAARPLPSCAAMIGYIHYTAGYANPVGLLGWMYVLEAVGNDLGTVVAKSLKNALKLPGSAGLRFVARHGVSDTDHARELTEQIQKYVTQDADLKDVDYVADVVADLYVRMFHEIGQERQRWD